MKWELSQLIEADSRFRISYVPNNPILVTYNIYYPASTNCTQRNPLANLRYFIIVRSKNELLHKLTVQPYVNFEFKALCVHYFDFHSDKSLYFPKYTTVNSVYIRNYWLNKNEFSISWKSYVGLCWCWCVGGRALISVPRSVTFPGALCSERRSHHLIAQLRERSRIARFGMTSHDMSLKPNWWAF